MANKKHEYTEAEYHVLRWAVVLLTIANIAGWCSV